jgi:hypothetical protein
MLYSPNAFEAAPYEVPSTIMIAPTTGSAEEFRTVPLIIVCAPTDKHDKKNKNRIDFFFI